MMKRRIRKLTNAMAKKITGETFLLCRECNMEEIAVSVDTKSVICPRCVQRMVPAPVLSVAKPKSDKPRGWHFKKYFEHEGVVYSMGEIVTDRSEIAELKKQYGKSIRAKKAPTQKRGKSNARASR